MVKAKKHLGQHFLTDKNIAQKIVNALSPEQQNILEIGPGMGVLTQLILSNTDKKLIALDVDKESVAYLQQHFPENKDQFLLQDFLKADLSQFFQSPFAVIGNFPYNISSQILFKVLENRSRVPELVGMYQKEVAERIASKPGNKVYGILSVLAQAFYDTEYLFTVHEHVFSPAPKVKSAVIKMKRKPELNLGCDEALFFKVVKGGFNQRRKTLRNSLKRVHPQLTPEIPFLDKRPEQLSVKDFILLTSAIEKIPKQA